MDQVINVRSKDDEDDEDVDEIKRKRFDELKSENGERGEIK